MKSLRIGLGAVLAGVGIVFFILPGSILFLIAGLLVLSYDFPVARGWLRSCQKGMTKSAKALDNFFYKRRYSKR